MHALYWSGTREIEPREERNRELPKTFRLRFLVIRNSNKKSNPIKVFVSSSSTCWRYICPVEVDGDVAPLPLEFGQLRMKSKSSKAPEKLSDWVAEGESVRNRLCFLELQLAELKGKRSYVTVNFYRTKITPTRKGGRYKHFY